MRYNCEAVRTNSALSATAGEAIKMAQLSSIRSSETRLMDKTKYRRKKQFFRTISLLNWLFAENSYGLIQAMAVCTEPKTKSRYWRTPAKCCC